MVERTLAGHYEDLKERIIGIEVFGRTPDYDTSLDPTVRVAANEVRKRLALYYGEARHGRELRIDVPLRSYVAEFKLPEQSVKPRDQEAQEREPHEQVSRPKGHHESNLPQETTPEVQTSPKNRGVRNALIGSFVGAVILALGIWVIHRILAPAAMIDAFWAPVVNGNGQVLICIGSPPKGTSTTPQPDTPPGVARPGMPWYEFSQQRVNVSMTDVTAANAVSSFLRRKGKDSLVRPAQGTSLSDLRSSPAVLLGSFQNEWATRLGTDLHYRFRKESDLGVRWIEDKNSPEKRTWFVDLSAPYDQVNSDYALISRVQDRTTGQWWIGIAGLTGLGTLGADQMVLDSKAMAAIAPRLPKDWEHANLQIVLAINMVEGSPGASDVVAIYSW
jgi:hypothetical protein